MEIAVVLPALTSVLCLAFAVALLDQFRQRRRSYQAVWALGMVFFFAASGCEAIAGASGWSEPLYRVWYLAGAVWTAGWLGLGTALLLRRTRFGFAFAGSLILAGLFTFLAQQRYQYADAGFAATVYLSAAAVFAIAIAIAAQRRSSRWADLATLAVVAATLVSLLLMATTTLPPPGYALDPATDVPTGSILPGSLRLLTPFMNVTGFFSLFLGALFSTYTLMPRHTILAYTLDPDQPAARRLAGMAVAAVAIPVNFLASLPGAFRALLAGRLDSRVPATILIAIGAVFPALADSLGRFGTTGFHYIGNFLGVAFIFAGFLVSIEIINEVRVPFTRIVLRPARRGAQAQGEPGEPH